MAVSSALGSRAWLDSYSLGDNVAQLSEMSWAVAQFDRSTIEHEGNARGDGRRDGRMAIVTLYDTATGKSRDVLTDFPASRADRLLTWAHRPLVGAAAITCWGQQDTLGTRLEQNGDLLLDAAVVGNRYGVEAGDMLTAGLITSTGAENLASLDTGVAATDFGLQAYLHVAAFTGTSITVTIQDSDDDGATDAYAAVPGAAFTAATAAGFQRIQTGRTENVKRWLRLALTGTYSNAQIVVVVVVNRLAAVNF